jgi:hypothetical protein
MRPSTTIGSIRSSARDGVRFPHDFNAHRQARGQLQCRLMARRTMCTKARDPAHHRGTRQAFRPKSFHDDNMRRTSVPLVVLVQVNGQNLLRCSLSRLPTYRPLALEVFFELRSKAVPLNLWSVPAAESASPPYSGARLRNRYERRSEPGTESRSCAASESPRQSSGSGLTNPKSSPCTQAC